MLLGGNFAYAADWTLPTPTVSELTTASTVDDATAYYMYNVQQHGFVLGANSWGTRASVGTSGIPVKIVELNEGAYGIYNVNSSVYFSPDGTSSIWVDGSRTYYDQWTLTTVDASAYTYKFGHSYWIQDAESISFGCLASSTLEIPELNLYTPTDVPEGDELYDTWSFLSTDEYETFQPKLVIYFDALSLKAAIDSALAKYPSLDIADEQAVYNNTESPVDSLITKAISSIEEKVKAAAAEEARNSATVSNPKDLSSLITNATFDNITYEGWSGSGFGSGGTVGPCAERYSMTFDTWQQIDNLPVGVYKLSASGFYRAGYTDGSLSLYQQGDASINNCKLYAANIAADGNDTLTTSVMNNFCGIQANNSLGVSGETSATDGDYTYYVPNTMASAVEYFTQGYYADNEVMFGVTEGSAKIGVYKTVTITGDWSIFDNFAITYYGGAADAYQLWNSKAMADVPSYDAVEYVTPSVVEAYKSVIAACSTASTYAEVMANIKNSKDAQAVVDANVAAWQALIDAKTAAEKVAGDKTIECDEKDVLSDYLEFDLADAIDGKSFTTEELLAAVAYVDSMRQEVIQNGLKAGTDFTEYLTNPAFSTGNNTGWSGSPTVNKYCGEKYGLNADFDVYQEVKNAPVGVYQISMQGFYREKRNDGSPANEAWNLFFTEDGETRVPAPDTLAYVYLNDNKTAVKSVFDYQVMDGQLYTGSADSDPLGIYWYPNDMTTAAEAFAEGAYEVSAFGLVAEKGDALRIGVKGHLGSSDWAIFDNFKLTYQAYEVTYVQPEFIKAVESLNASNLMGTEVKAKVEDLKSEAAAIDQTDGKAMFKCLASIYALNNEIESSVAVFTELAEANANLEQAISESEAAEATKNDASTLYEAIAAALKNQTYTTEDATNAIASIDEMVNKLAIPAGIEDANDENAIDLTALIKSASFTDDSEAATYEGWTIANLGSGTTSAAQSGFEVYNQTFNIYQDLSGLPAGTYEVGVQAFSRDGSSTEDIAAWQAGTPANVKLYAVAGTTSYETAIQHMAAIENLYEEAPGYGTEYSFQNIVGEDTTTYWYPNNMQSVAGYFADEKFVNKLVIKLGEDETLRIGIRNDSYISTQWMMMDNWTLTYYGTNSSKEVVDGLEQMTATKVVKVEKFNLSGMRVSGKQQGITLVRTTMSDGTVVVRKVANN